MIKCALQYGDTLQIGLEFGNVGFEEKGKPEYPEKNLSEEGQNQPQTQPTYDAESGNRTRATLVGSECSHLCSNSAPQTSDTFEQNKSLKLDVRRLCSEAFI